MQSLLATLRLTYLCEVNLHPCKYFFQLLPLECGATIECGTTIESGTTVECGTAVEYCTQLNWHKSITVALDYRLGKLVRMPACVPSMHEI